MKCLSTIILALGSLSVMAQSGGSVSFTSGTVAEFAFEKIEGKRYLADMTQAGIGDKALETWVETMSDHILIGSDTIIAINDRDVHDYTWDEEEALHKAPRHELDIITAQGQKKHVVLESKEYW